MPSSFNIFMHRKTWLASAQTLEISRRSHRRSPIRQVSDAMLFAFMTDEDWRTNWCSRVFVCFAQWDLHMFFFFPHHITVCLNLSWRGRVRCWNIAQLDGLHQIVSDRKVGLWSSGFSPGNSTGFHPIPTSQSNLAAFESQVVQYRSGALFTHNTSSLTNSLA